MCEELIEGPKSRTVKICGICAMRVIPWAAFPHNYRALVSCSFGVAVYAYGDDMRIVKVRQQSRDDPEAAEVAREKAEEKAELERERRGEQAIEAEAYPMGAPEPYENDLENLRNRELDEDQDAATGNGGEY